LLSFLKPHAVPIAVLRDKFDDDCTIREVAALTGHSTLSEIQCYTKAFDRKRLAVTAMQSISSLTGGEK